MLTFKPRDYKSLGDEYKNDASALGYIAYDDSGCDCGRVVFYLDGYSMRITSVAVPDGDAETQEGLIRSALNYAGNRNAYVAYYCAPQAQNVALLLGFIKQGDKLYGEIPFLLAGSCCKDKNNF